MRTVLLLFGILALSPHLAYAQEKTCPTIELDAPGESMHGLPIWNQHSLPACDDFSASLDSNCGFHSASVIGQKMRGGVCYFKVRNSWGSAGLFTPKTEHGNYWIPAEALSRNTLRVVELKHP